MKTFYNVVNAIVEWVQFFLQTCEKLQNYSFKQGKKEQILSEVCIIKKGLVVLFTWDVMRKSMFKRPVYTSFVAKIYLWSKLVEHKKSGLIFYFGLSFRQWKLQRVNWLPPRTIVARVFLKIIFRGCRIIHSLSNGAMLERLVNATSWCNSLCKYNTRIGVFVFQAYLLLSLIHIWRCRRRG